MSAYTYPPPGLSVDEYLRVEEASPLRHEYVAGELFLLSGVTTRHNRITRNVVLALHAGGGPCEVLFTDVKLRAANDRIYYPDVMVTCEPLTGDEHVVEQPRVVVEVTSPSTRRIDRVEKLAAYREIPSLRAYLVIEQGERRVDRHWRDDGGVWRADVVTDATGGTLAVPCPDTLLTLNDVYRGVTPGGGA